MKWGRRFLILAVSTLMVALVGVWWWRWQAPYRTLITFTNALYDGDIKTLYDLTPSHEREQTGLNMALLERTYHQLSPLLQQHYPRDHLGRIQRASEAIRHPNEVAFYLWFQFQDKRYPMMVYLCRLPNESGWKVPFSYFVWLMAKGFYSDPNLFMFSLGYKRVATTDGGSLRLP